MSETVIENKAENNIWEGRYHVQVQAEEAYGYKDVIFYLFQPRMDVEEAHKLLEPFGYNLEDYGNEYLSSLAADTFTIVEAIELSDYLEEFDGITVNIKQSAIPMPGFIGHGAIPVGGMQDFHMFSEIEGYPLAFDVWGYRDLRNHVETDDRRVEGLTRYVRKSLEDAPNLIGRVIEELQKEANY